MTSAVHTRTSRPPIVVVMGHVDHGKSTLLDYIRHTNTVEKEAGGITQHVAAYEVVHEHEGERKRITFIDTPGHAAFQTIRARGAHAADIAILVVAADDGVKTQTIEALESIKASNIPYIVAINKTDKPNADINRTQSSLMEHGVYLEKLGGDVPWVAISAKQGTGVSELLDLVLLVAELQHYTADTTIPASGYVIEAHREAKRGVAATLIITAGTLESGMSVLAGTALAPVRIMETAAGKTIKTATCSSPIVLVGFDELPPVGATFHAYKQKKEAEEAREEARALVQKVESPAAAPGSSDSFVIPLIVRADTTGSLEAIAHEIAKLPTERAIISIVQSGIGSITENDIKGAAAQLNNHAIVFGFNVSADALAQERARQFGVDIETFTIIYKLTERLEELRKERTPRMMVEETLGRATVIKVFSEHKGVHVFGGKVAEGVLQKNTQARVVRRGIVVGTGKITNLQSHKENVSRVEAGSEFGAQAESSFQIAQGDTLECFSTVMK